MSEHDEVPAEPIKVKRVRKSKTAEPVEVDDAPIKKPTKRTPKIKIKDEVSESIEETKDA